MTSKLIPGKLYTHTGITLTCHGNRRHGVLVRPGTIWLYLGENDIAKHEMTLPDNILVGDKVWRTVLPPLALIHQMGTDDV